jgi:predicted DNA-binding transcriptional regulator AlpA
MVDDQLLTAKESASEVRLSVPGFWRAVSSGRLPQPVYPMARAPRWFRSELRAAIELTRAMPREQKQARRTARIATLREAEEAATA